MRRRVGLVAVGVVATVAAVLVVLGLRNGYAADGPVVRHDPGWLGAVGPASPREIRGEFTIAIDGCLLLGYAAVVWPAGTSWDPEAREVVLPDGDRVHVRSVVRGPGAAYETVGPDLADALGGCESHAPVAVFDPEADLTALDIGYR